MTLKAQPAELVSQAVQGNRAALARIISKIESRHADADELNQILFPKTGKAMVWGITGPPGAGKSSTVDQLLVHLRKQGKKVAVVAVDPSSPFSGGAILGDRIRMQQHSSDSGVYIRSLGTKGRHGGLSHSTKEVVMALDAVGFDVILVETAGVGQTELDILKLAHTVLVILVPESGDSIQVMKAGLMEIADVFAVNKSDRPEADKLVRELTQMVGLNPHDENSWMMPVVKTEAVRDVGVSDLLKVLLEHHEFLKKSGKLREKLRVFLTEEVFDLLLLELYQNLQTAFDTPGGQDVIGQMLDKKITPHQAARLMTGKV